MFRALWNGAVLAESDHTITLESLPPAARARPALRLARAARLLTRRLARRLQPVARPPGPHAC
jgi:hypothetical protein